MKTGRIKKFARILKFSNEQFKKFGIKVVKI